MNTHLQKIKDYLLSLSQTIKLLIIRFYKIGTGETKLTRDFIFLFASWFSLLIFFSFFILAEQNPFRLLVPFQLYSYPSFDHREPIVIYISNGEGEQIPIHRKVLKREEPGDFIYQIVGEVGSPPYFDSVEALAKDGKLFSPKKLLDIRFALKQSWFLEKESKLVIDWNVQILQDVMEKYRLPRTKSEETNDSEEENPNAPVDTITYYTAGSDSGPKESEEVVNKRRILAMDSTIRALNASLFENFINLKSIEHQFSGEVSPVYHWESLSAKVTRP
ncbi:hypothetical protein ND861_11585 [Leptospira sp. 2 VSF19]|uniref:Uncharacterized protein n=1 Tax=Leptospira soteropolitanensis TaxID=2950025 RepID=A0AAW5VH24_9LEPT|nr:hypothetical protein [Leptospira soteropolitanensis]MCW7493053.1 hypothetical protein [Leptospira soteropolitanensis]MCW7500877.1 hypothetical protein [Leptospira soteropolitanensis]MCW7522904.1 hypothetical protein [Leptospira soteropolitanensis]MCW7526990.1 hypothetical protein [Leptospira soteropolitanensis]MCW7530622.1 hypothetical protein [Leptospira soteropolitanensis]